MEIKNTIGNASEAQVEDVNGKSENTSDTANKSASSEKHNTVHRNYKDRFFRQLFNEPKNFLTLYNNLTKQKLKLEETALENVTLKEGFYSGPINDLSMLVNGKLVVLVEHQSTICPNMPLRMLEYISLIYSKIIPNYDNIIYSPKPVQIPTPEFFVVYNGLKKFKEDIIELSNIFIDENSPSSLKLKIKVLDLNEDKENIFDKEELNNQNVLLGYYTLIKYIHEFQSEEGTSNNTKLIDGMPSYIAKAIKKCKEEKLLEDYLNIKENLEMIAQDYEPMIELQLHDQELTEAVTDEVTKKVTKSVTDEVTERVTKSVTDEVTKKVTKSVTDEVTDKAIENLICNFNFTNEQLKTTYPEVSDERINKIRDSIKTK